MESSNRDSLTVRARSLYNTLKWKLKNSGPSNSIAPTKEPVTMMITWVLRLIDGVSRHRFLGNDPDPGPPPTTTSPESPGL
ncbi:unnamed protein product [Larinioides sclopetarius]|uniref:Uncharacterized protein n=1 Tax=Larinioides sclopetarius TaxID=280406 RepID=A0AAV1ZIG8_9ARAC